MKKLSDELNLAGRIETITAMDFRKQPGEVLASVRLGKTFVITKAGKAVAVLSGLPGTQLSINVDSKGKVSYVL